MPKTDHHGDLIIRGNGCVIDMCWTIHGCARPNSIGKFTASVLNRTRGQRPILTGTRMTVICVPSVTHCSQAITP